LVVHCTPQSVFRVRPATRCSSTLSGTWFMRVSDQTAQTPVYPGHSSPILCASFSPTGQHLATGSGDTTARLWDLNTETPSHVLAGHVGWVLCVEWEAMGRKLATGGHDGHVRVASHLTDECTLAEIPVSFYLHRWRPYGDHWTVFFSQSGSTVGPKIRETDRRCSERPYKMDNITLMGANSFVRAAFLL
jgi:WD40 repeat protein